MPSARIQELVDRAGLPEGSDVSLTFECTSGLWTATAVVPPRAPLCGVFIFKHTSVSLATALSRCAEDCVRRGLRS